MFCVKWFDTAYPSMVMSEYFDDRVDAEYFAQGRRAYGFQTVIMEF